MEEALQISNASFVCTEERLGPRRDHLYVVIPMITIYVIIFLTGTIGNISTCIVISRNKAMHTATNYYLFSLAVSDLLLLITGLPQEIYLMWSRYPYIFGSTFCFLRGLFAETSANATVLTITAFTIERYLAICHPFLSHTMSKLSRAVKFILVIWILAVCLAIPQAMQFEIVKGEDNCEMCLFVHPFIKHSFEVSTFLFFVTPMTLITVLYILIGVRLKSSSMVKKRNSRARLQTNSSRKVVNMLVAVVVGFFICWAPFHAQRLYSLYSTLSKHDPEDHPFYLKIYEIVTYISGILYYVSATINPILYNIMSAKFREAFKETFARCCGLKRLQHGRTQRSYSVLSRTGQRCPDSDSGKDDPSIHTHTTLAHKTSVESFNGTGSRKCKSLVIIKSEEHSHRGVNWNREIGVELQNPIRENAGNMSKQRSLRLHVTDGKPSKLKSVWQYFECLSERSTDLNPAYASPKDSNIVLELESPPKGSPVRRYRHCDISNSSLKDVESGDIQDELTDYMLEVKKRELFS